MVITPKNNSVTEAWVRESEHSDTVVTEQTRTTKCRHRRSHQQSRCVLVESVLSATKYKMWNMHCLSILEQRFLPQVQTHFPRHIGTRIWWWVPKPYKDLVRTNLNGPDYVAQPSWKTDTAHGTLTEQPRDAVKFRPNHEATVPRIWVFIAGNVVYGTREQILCNGYPPRFQKYIVGPAFEDGRWQHSDVLEV